MPNRDARNNYKHTSGMKAAMWCVGLQGLFCIITAALLLQLPLKTYKLVLPYNLVVLTPLLVHGAMLFAERGHRLVKNVLGIIGGLCGFCVVLLGFVITQDLDGAKLAAVTAFWAVIKNESDYFLYGIAVSFGGLVMMILSLTYAKIGESRPSPHVVHASREQAAPAGGTSKPGGLDTSW